MLWKHNVSSRLAVLLSVLLTVWLLSSDIYAKHGNYEGEGFFQSIKDGSIKSVEAEIEEDPAYLNSTDRVSDHPPF